MFFLLCVSSERGGVWLFRIHSQEAAALGLFGLGRVTFSVYVLGLFSCPLGVPKVPLRNPAKDRFSLRLSSDLGGVWVFRIHCREVAALGLSGLGRVTFSVYVLGLFSSPLGAPKVGGQVWGALHKRLQRWTSVGWRCTSVGVATLNKRVCNAEQAFWNAAQACLQRWASALGGWSWQSRPLAKTLATVQVEKLTAMRVGNPHGVVFIGKNKAKLSRIFFCPFFRYLGFSRPTPRKRNESRSDISWRLRSRPPASQAKRCVAPMPR